MCFREDRHLLDFRVGTEIDLAENKWNRTLVLKDATQNVIAQVQTTLSQQSCVYWYTYHFVTPLANKILSNLFPHFTHACTWNPNPIIVI